MFINLHKRIFQFPFLSYDFLAKFGGNTFTWLINSEYFVSFLKMNYFSWLSAVAGVENDLRFARDYVFDKVMKSVSVKHGLQTAN